MDKVETEIKMLQRNMEVRDEQLKVAREDIQ